MWVGCENEGSNGKERWTRVGFYIVREMPRPLFKIQPDVDMPTWCRIRSRDLRPTKDVPN